MKIFLSKHHTFINFVVESGEWKDIKVSGYYPVPYTMQLDQSYRSVVYLLYNHGMPVCLQDI